MAVAHHRHHCTLFEARQPGSKEYSLSPRPVELANDDTMEGRYGRLAVIIAQKSCQLPWTPPSLRSCHRGWMSCERLATILHAFAAQIGRFTLHVGFERVLLRQHSIGYHRTERQSDITTYIPGKDVPSAAASRASAGVVVHLFSYGGLYFLHSATTSLSLVGPSHCPSSKLCYVVKRQARADAPVRISIALSARQFCDWRRMRCLFFDGNMGNIRTMNNVLHTQENVVDTRNSASAARIQHANDLREYSSTDSQDKWVFYNYYPQIMSLLGEEPFEMGVHRKQKSFEKCPSDYSCRDSGIDIGTSRMHAEQGLHDTCDNDPQSGTVDRPITKSATEASTQGQYWSVDEMITLSLLEAMESRGQANYHVGGSRYRQSSTGKRRMSSMWKAIAKLFRKLRLP